MKQNINKDINYNSNKFFHNLEHYKKLIFITPPCMSSNKRRTLNKGWDPKLMPMAFIANSALSTQPLNGV